MQLIAQFIELLPLLLILLLPGLALVWTWLYHARMQSGRPISFRALPGLASLETLLSQVAESGQAVHVAIGSSRASAVGPTAETVAGLLVTQRLAENTTRRGGNIAVTTGDIAAHASARGGVRQAYQNTGFASDYNPDAIQMVAQQDQIGFAAGVTTRYQSQHFDASLLVGEFGPEALLMTAEGNHQRVPQIAASTNLAALPTLLLSADATLIGEEVFAAEAYLASGKAPAARLLTQDALRRTLIVILFAGLLYQIANVVFALGLPSL